MARKQSTVPTSAPVVETPVETPAPVVAFTAIMLAVGNAALDDAALSSAVHGAVADLNKAGRESVIGDLNKAGIAALSGPMESVDMAVARRTALAAQAVLTVPNKAAKAASPGLTRDDAIAIMTARVQVALATIATTLPGDADTFHLTTAEVWPIVRNVFESVAHDDSVGAVGPDDTPDMIATRSRIQSALSRSIGRSDRAQQSPDGAVAGYVAQVMAERPAGHKVTVAALRGPDGSPIVRDVTLADGTVIEGYRPSPGAVTAYAARIHGTDSRADGAIKVTSAPWAFTR